MVFRGPRPYFRPIENDIDCHTQWLFYAAPASESAFITSAQRAGRLVCGWGFQQGAVGECLLREVGPVSYRAASITLSTTSVTGLDASMIVAPRLS
ncbi:hypothetical protein GCM10012278_83180 [Nonomuraea glycinis]|uniref:Uncharacterized protein n=1 Tax=Nonomuraea glycinis TaxID=2047744 RepID=A0A918ADF3_9ACTN|nr:hypothetical protein GCM10012278_83180 [Nonomuraea glycinis]